MARWFKKKRPRAKIEWSVDKELQDRVTKLAASCELDYVKSSRIFCYKSSGAQTRALARIWGLPRIWQQTLGLEPAYVLEVIGERFDKLDTEEQDRVLIHELLHIPKNFSGALVPHKRKGGVNESKVWQLYNLRRKS